MVEPRADPEVREALTELELYLSDSIPPLVVAGSAELLLKYPPDLVAGSIRSWTSAQFAKGGESVSDYLFHAVKKIHMLGEFRLVPREALERYLEGLKAFVLADCPEEDRAHLAESFTRLSETTGSGTAAPIVTLHRQSAGPRATSGSGAPAAAVATDDARERRLSLLLKRLEAQASQASQPEGRAALTETLAAAARGSSSARDIEEYLSRLKGLGVQVGTADVFRALASSLPAWAPPAGAAVPGAPAAAAPGSSAADAMQRMVAEVDDPREGARRFQELVRAAVERFNEGSLTQAVSTLDAAERLVAEKKVDAGTADLARAKGDEGLDPERLRVAAEGTIQHPALRRLLGFFRGLSPEGLLDQLAREEKRDRRRLLLALLEVHGDAARAAAFEALASPISDHAAQDWYLRRNLLYLLRRIPRPPDAPTAQEAEVTARHLHLKFPPPLLKEALANLSQLRDPKSEAGLVEFLGELEKALGKDSDSPHDAKELVGLLDRVAAALARLPSSSARRALLDHAEKRDASLGDSAARLAELGSQDLSDDAESLGRLLASLKSNLPFKLFGLALHQNDQVLRSTIEALSGTKAPAVKAALEEIVSRFPDKEIAKTASRALAALQKPAPAPGAAAAAAAGPATASFAAQSGPAASSPGAAPSLTGDLEVFGLPALLQSLSDSGQSGSLTLRDPRGQVFGGMRLKGGKLRACQTGALTGVDAFYQLLERPSPGQFQFLKAADAGDETNTASLKEILPLTLEAMRRYDELRQAAALVPDDAKLKPTDVKPAPFPGEKDGLFQKDVWSRASRGATPRECEAEIKTDAYRIRRLLAHWVEQGALAPQ
jgi:hypothetical protein